jgi:hypothetical protein
MFILVSDKTLFMEYTHGGGFFQTHGHSISKGGGQMRCRNQLLAIGVLACMNLSTAHAVPIYYTFEGSITYPVYDSTGYMGDLGLDIGDPVSLTFMVDRGRQVGTDAVYVSNHDNGNPASNFIFHDSFYAELVESSVFDLIQTQYPEIDTGGDPWDGYGHVNSFYRNGLLQRHDGDVYLYASVPSLGSIGLYIYDDISTWEVGSTHSNDNNTTLTPNVPGISSSFHSSLTLSDISTSFDSINDESLELSAQGGGDYALWASATSEHHSVPEPSTFVLLGIGMIGGFGVNHLKGRRG